MAQPMAAGQEPPLRAGAGEAAEAAADPRKCGAQRTDLLAVRPVCAVASAAGNPPQLSNAMPMTTLRDWCDHHLRYSYRIVSVPSDAVVVGPTVKRERTLTTTVQVGEQCIIVGASRLGERRRRQERVDWVVSNVGCPTEA